MKLSGIWSAVIIITLFFFASCKANNAKDQIVNNWKIISITGEAAGKIPDSILADSYTGASIEFTKDGKFEVRFPAEDMVKGTYRLSDDNKNIYSTTEGSTVIDTLKILEISKNKVVLSQKNEMVGQFAFTMIPK